VALGCFVKLSGAPPSQIELAARLQQGLPADDVTLAQEFEAARLAAWADLAMAELRR
jgi:hypothetical protein